jgi:hypothetical protein
MEPAEESSLRPEHRQFDGITFVRQAFVLVVLLIVFFLNCPFALASDTFLLHSGGKVTGEWLNDGQPAQQEYQIRTSGGAHLRLARSQVKQTIRVGPLEEKYLQMRHNYPDTVAGHMALAEWCKENRLRDHRREHLRRVLVHDRSHEDANLSLGNVLVHNEWLSPEERLRRKGLVKFEDRWRTAQQVEIIKRSRVYKKARKSWAGKLKNWRENLFSRKAEKARLAREGIRGITDPSAIWALAERYMQEPFPAVKRVYLEVAAKIKGGNAEKMLLVISLIEPDPDMRQGCLDLLIEREPERAVDFYVKALKDKSNYKVNRAAYALTQFKDDSVVSPLIDALITVHPIVSGNPHRSPDAITSTFNTDGGAGGGLKTGNQTKVSYRRVPNQTVLQALILMTNTNFDFNQEAWRNWLAVRDSQSPEVRSRRD